MEAVMHIQVMQATIGVATSSMLPTMGTISRTRLPQMHRERAAIPPLVMHAVVMLEHGLNDESDVFLTVYRNLAIYSHSFQSALTTRLVFLGTISHIGNQADDIVKGMFRVSIVYYGNTRALIQRTLVKHTS